MKLWPSDAKYSEPAGTVRGFTDGFENTGYHVSGDLAENLGAERGVAVSRTR